MVELRSIGTEVRSIFVEVVFLTWLLSFILLISNTYISALYLMLFLGYSYKPETARSVNTTVNRFYLTFACFTSISVSKSIKCCYKNTYWDNRLLEIHYFFWPCIYRTLRRWILAAVCMGTLFVLEPDSSPRWPSKAFPQSCNSQAPRTARIKLFTYPEISGLFSAQIALVAIIFHCQIPLLCEDLLS